MPNFVKKKAPPIMQNNVKPLRYNYHGFYCYMILPSPLYNIDIIV